MIGRRWSRPGHDPRGQTLVEFALVIPLVLLIMLGLFDFGRAIAAYNSVSNAARTAARVAIVNQDPDLIQEAAEREAVGIVVTVEIDYLDEGNDCSVTLKLGCIVEVRVSHDYVAATPIIGHLVGPMTLASASQLPIEHIPSP
jgi:hypothetical protein